MLLTSCYYAETFLPCYLLAQFKKKKEYIFDSTKFIWSYLVFLHLSHPNMSVAINKYKFAFIVQSFKSILYKFTLVFPLIPQMTRLCGQRQFSAGHLENFRRKKTFFFWKIYEFKFYQLLKQNNN